MATAYTKEEFDSNIGGASVYSQSGTIDERIVRALLYLQSAISQEASSRASADNTLTTNLNTEITNRKNADTSEATARSNADTAEATARSNADTAEKNARVAADEAEKKARIAADEAEAKTRKATDDALEAKKLNRFDKDDASDWEDRTEGKNIWEEVSASNKPMTSKALYDAFMSKVNTYTFRPEDWDTIATRDSEKPVTSGGVELFFRQFFQKESLLVPVDTYGVIYLPFDQDNSKVYQLTILAEKEIIHFSVSGFGLYGASLVKNSTTKFWQYKGSSGFFIYFMLPFSCEVQILTTCMTLLENNENIKVNTSEELPQKAIMCSLLKL